MVPAMVLAERWGMVSHDGILDLDSIDGIAVIVGGRVVNQTLQFIETPRTDFWGKYCGSKSFTKDIYC